MPRRAHQGRRAFRGGAVGASRRSAVAMTGAALLGCIALAAPGLARSAVAQELRDVSISGNSLGGFVLPILPVQSDLRIRCVKAWLWKSDDTQRLQLQGDIRISVASYEFAAERAFVWINRLPSAQGLINQVAIWFPEVDEPTRRAGLSASGRDLLVTASTMGEVSTRATLWEDADPPSSAERGLAESRLQRYLAAIAGGQPELRPIPRVDRPPVAPPPQIEVGGRVEAAPPPAPPTAASIRVPSDGTPILPPQGTLGFFGRTTTVDEATDTIAVEGSVLIDWLGGNPADPQGAVQLTADRAVIFLKPGTLKSLTSRTGTLSAAGVDGVYLEGGVTATDFNYTVRGKRIYYDLRTNQALMVDAVLRTSIRRGIPVVARAAELRQVASEQFTAQQAQVSTSEFFTPHLAVGAERVTVSRQAGDETLIEGRNATFRLSGTPVLWFPRFSGTADRFPLRSVSSGYNSFRGVEVETRWDLFNALGLEAPPGLEGELVGDVYSSNGVGGGAKLAYERDQQRGNADLYGFYDFGNEEQSSAGREYISDKTARGIASMDYQTMLGSDLLMQTQFNYISDPAFLSTFRQQDFAEHREYETSGYLRWQTGNSQFSVLGKYDVDNSVVNSYQLASRPYSVDKLPQVDYSRYGDELFDFLSWTQEYSANAMGLRFTKGTPESIAAPNAAFFPPYYPAPDPFTQDNLPIANAYTSSGYDQDLRSRVYTRQELAMPLAWAGVKIVPFVGLTGIGYFFESFDDYTPEASDYRALLSAGARFSTEFTRVFESVQSRSLDLNRLRWVIQPNATLWSAYDTDSANDYPVYDQQVEAISAASAAQAGITQRLQTYRGGPGNWRSVDWIVVDMGVVVSDHNNTYQRQPESPLKAAQSPLPTFYRWRPEYSQWGSHAYMNASWQMSSTFTFITSGVFLDGSERPDGGSASSWLGRGSIGVAMYHSPEVSTFVEYRYVNNFDPTGAYPSDELLNVGLSYKIGKLWQLGLGPQFDLGQGDFRSLSAQLVRIFPDFDFGIGVSYDSIVDEYSFNAKLRVGGPNQRPVWTFSQATPQFPSPWVGMLNR